MRDYLTNDNTKDILRLCIEALHGKACTDATAVLLLEQLDALRPLRTAKLVYNHGSRFARNKPADDWGSDDVWAWAIYQLVFRAVSPESESPWSDTEPWDPSQYGNRWDALVEIHAKLLEAYLPVVMKRVNEVYQKKARELGIDSNAEAQDDPN